jgi:hypothetical protein
MESGPPMHLTGKSPEGPGFRINNHLNSTPMQSEGKFIIQEPCHEDWTAMTPTDQGRFCAACSKCVIDLTNKQPTEIKEIYQANDGDVCGRMSVSQFISPTQPERHTDDLPYASQVLKKLQLFAVALLATFSFAFQTVQAQDRPIKGKIAHVPSDVRIEGQVKWDHGMEASGVTIEVWHGNDLEQTSLTDENGKFAFTNLERGRYRIVAKAGDWITTETTTDAWSGGKFMVTLRLEDVQVDGGIGYIEELLPAEVDVPEVTVMGTTVYIEPDTAPIMKPSMLGQIAWMPETEKCRTNPLPPLVDVVETEVPIDETVLADPRGAESPNADLIDKQSTEETLVLDDLQFTVFPNPTDGELNIRLDSPSKRPVRYFLYDLNGRSLAAHRWEPGMTAEYQMDLSRYAAGTYILRLISGETMVEKRVIKRR